MDVEVLPIIRDVFRSVEKENNDGSQRNKDSLDASLKILELVGFILQKICRFGAVVGRRVH